LFLRFELLRLLLERIESDFSVWDHILFVSCLIAAAFISGMFKAALFLTKNFFEQMNIFPLLLLYIFLIAIFSTI